MGYSSSECKSNHENWEFEWNFLKDINWNICIYIYELLFSTGSFAKSDWLFRKPPKLQLVLGSKIPTAGMPVWRASDSDTSDDDLPMGDDESSEDLDVSDFTCQDQGLKGWCTKG